MEKGCVPRDRETTRDREGVRTRERKGGANEELRDVKKD
jgi:hypothetical protein